MRLSLVLGFGLMTTACAITQQARLYDLQSSQVLTATFRSNGSGRGPIWIGPADQPTCRGEFVTIAGGETQWGTIYSGAQIAQVMAVATADAQRGAAVVTCVDTSVIECEYVASASTGGGQGACRDNRGRQYRLMF